MKEDILDGLQKELKEFFTTPFVNTRTNREILTQVARNYLQQFEPVVHYKVRGIVQYYRVDNTVYGIWSDGEEQVIQMCNTAEEAYRWIEQNSGILNFEITEEKNEAFI